MSLNVIEASWQALVDSFEYKLYKDAKRGRRDAARAATARRARDDRGRSDAGSRRAAYSGPRASGLRRFVPRSDDLPRPQRHHAAAPRGAATRCCRSSRRAAATPRAPTPPAARRARRSSRRGARSRRRSACRAGEIVFTSGGTESNNLALLGAVARSARRAPRGVADRARVGARPAARARAPRRGVSLAAGRRRRPGDCRRRRRRAAPGDGAGVGRLGEQRDRHGAADRGDRAPLPARAACCCTSMRCRRSASCRSTRGGVDLCRSRRTSSAARSASARWSCAAAWRLRPLALRRRAGARPRPGHRERRAAIVGFAAALRGAAVGWRGVAALRERLWARLAPLGGVRRHSPADGLPAEHAERRLRRRARRGAGGGARPRGRRGVGRLGLRRRRGRAVARAARPRLRRGARRATACASASARRRRRTRSMRRAAALCSRRRAQRAARAARQRTRWRDGDDALRARAGASSAMSGGVDSSLAAALLVEQGYDVVGVSMRLWDGGAGERQRLLLARRLPRCAPGRRAARHSVLRDGLPRRVRRAPWSTTFVAEYRRGRTPNPCARCNQFVKFAGFWERARELGAERVATGHYARVAATAPAARRCCAASMRTRTSRTSSSPSSRAVLARTLLSGRRAAQDRGARRGRAARPAGGRASRTARRSASCRAAATRRSSSSAASAEPLRAGRDRRRGRARPGAPRRRASVHRRPAPRPRRRAAARRAT